MSHWNTPFYQEVIGRYRAPRATPRPDITSHDVFEDPAPDWLWMLVRDLLKRSGAEPDGGRTIVEACIAWCEAGDREARSVEIRSLLASTKGPRFPAIRRFLELHGVPILEYAVSFDVDALDVRALPLGHVRELVGKPSK